MTTQLKSMSFLPSLKGGTILFASYTLEIISDSTGNMTLKVLTAILTILGIYDFALKIIYKHRKEREYRNAKKEAQKEKSADSKTVTDAGQK